MSTHTLKTWEYFYREVSQGVKKFEIRKDDRNFQVGDVLELYEYAAKEKQYTGRSFKVFVSSVMRDWPEFGLREGYCIMSVEKLNEESNGKEK